MRDADAEKHRGPETLEPQTSVQVVTYSTRRECSDIAEHEAAALTYAATKIAALLGGEFAGEYAPGAGDNDTARYFVPNETLSLDDARRLGIRDSTQLFGGCVPAAFLASKCITHDLIDAQAAAPRGWTSAFAQRVQNATLPGFSAFAKSDARSAAQRLLKHGDVRIKAPRQRGGHGQTVARTLAAVDAALEKIDDRDCSEYGIVLETNLTDIDTRSVGTVTIGREQISYCGTQFTTRDRSGDAVYGGSTLRAVRGDFAALLRLDWSSEEELAITQAMVYDLAAHAALEGFFASRRNYDICQGFDSDKRFCSGVLEQSWRIGGASPAELMAAQQLLRDEKAASVCVTCREIHARCAVPDAAEIYFCGTDASVGDITKFVGIDSIHY